ncbi:MAG: 3-isopropylmalate dehydratase [Peptococcaceae bacterium]|jgi:3-isopropylmalate/(R)-2-methylmalate dehydratase small subunit|nr:3-isopropylmalate dehydratase [Peptococcaceae bacterium]
MSQYIIRGRVHKYGDNINTDIISPGQYMELSYTEIAAHAMEGVDPGFSRKVKPGDIVVAGKNFGSGSSRETAPIALKYAGVGAVVADFFARIFYRNCINIGLPVVELPEVEDINAGDELEIQLLEGKVLNITQGKTYQFTALPQHILEMIQEGGLVSLLEKKVACK